jgi:small-conductance mechanosensitive channel
MPNDVTVIENELRSVTQAKRQVEEQIVALQQRLHDDEIWLKINTPATTGYQEAWEEILALQAYIAELYAQANCLADVLLELTLERERWYNPDPLLAS